MKTLFAEKICALRKERKISQRQAADDLRISQALLSHYENGAREPKLPFVRELARYYGVSVDFILGGQGASSAVERVRSEVEQALTLAQDIGGDELEIAAANYLRTVAEHLSLLLENPNRPYDPKMQMEIKSAETEVVTAARDFREDL